MTARRFASLTATALVAFGTLASPSARSQAPQVAIPKPGVAEIMTIEGEFVRVAYNNEGYISLGYRMANQSVGEEWMMLDIGATVRENTRPYKLTRGLISLDTPSGATIPLASNAEYRQVDLRALEKRATVVKDSINYFPPMARTACRIGFFADTESRAMAFDEVELSNSRACLGRLYFKVPGGIQHGQHWLNVKFADSLVRVPFRIFTEEERKTMSKHYGDIRKQVQDAFKKK